MLVQCTFLVFPLTIYMIYNKVLTYNNKNTILFVASLLIIVLMIQFALKLYESIYRNLLKFDEEIKQQRQNIEGILKVNQQSNVTYVEENGINLAQEVINSISKISSRNTMKIQYFLTKTYGASLVIYFALVMLIGKILVIIPMVFFGVNYYIAYLINKKYKNHQDKSEASISKEAIYVKEALNKLKVIKSLHVEDIIVDKARNLFDVTSNQKSWMNYYRGLLQKINMVFNITNIAFILLFGRYLFSLGWLHTEAIITCSLLTIWIARPFYHIVFNLNDDKADSTNNNRVDVTNIVISKDENSDNDSYDNENNKEVIKTLEEEGIVYSDSVTNYDLLVSLQKQYTNISFLDSDIGLFYANITENLTVFDDSKEEQVKDLIELLQVEELIFNLPYLYNYVVSGDNDQVIPYDLKLSIGLIRELVLKPELLIINHDVNRLNHNIKNGLLKYAKKHNIKLLIKKSQISVKDIITKAVVNNNESLLAEQDEY